MPYGPNLRLTPLIPIIAPASLSVVSRTSRYDVAMPISNLNFSRAGTGFGAPRVGSAQWGNLTDDELRDATDLADIGYGVVKDMGGGRGTPGYFKASSRAVALVYQTAYGGRIVGGASPCGAGVNCSFSQSFVGPAYKCEPRSPRVSPAPLPSGCSSSADSGSGAGADSETLPPTTAAECERARALPDLGSQTMYSASNDSIDDRKYAGPPALFAWEDGVLEVQHSFLPHEWRWAYNETPGAQQNIPLSALQYYAFRCEQWNARYDVRRSYEGGQQVFLTNKT